MIDERTQRIIDLLGLRPHPEGGFFREMFRSEAVVTLAPEGSTRNASTAIYFLLPAGEFSALHRIQTEEVWHHYAGAAVELHRIEPSGAHRVEILGGDVEHGERPQTVVFAHTLQAAIARGPGFALCGCTVSPGFEFADFEMPARDELLARFPAHEAVIRRFTRA